ncbi:hypothetical protein [Terrihabitans soli]|uniref:hypothetical protein n=1 Tax=Terrihabitans soli TaxID=708113 RepID=UPI001CA35BEC|nr:hypothetical protein [Terrihabitans soli]
MYRYACVFVAFAAAVSPVLAQAPENAPGVTWEAAPLPDVKPVQISLTTDMVERFVASLPTLLAMTRDLDREQGRVDPTAAEEDLSFVLVPYLFDPKIEAHINEKLAEFGFASYAEWANVAHSVSLVEEASDFTGAIDLAGQEQAARAEIEANKALSDEERSKAIDELKSQFAALAEFEPLPGNRETAAPFLERLRAARGR